MSQDAFDDLLDREVGRFVDQPAPAPAPGAGSDLIDRALDEVARLPPAPAGSAIGLELAAGAAGVGVVALALWVGFGSAGAPTPPDAPGTAVEIAPATAPEAAAPEPSPAPVPEEPEPALEPEPMAEAQAVPEPEPAGAAESKPEAVLSAAELLRRAQDHRNAGKTGPAIATYRELLTAHPKSSEAAVSLMSLGEIELVERAKPARALRYFDRYLRIGGPLGEEARHGRVRALRKLGRTQDELEAIDALLAAHPNSVYADSVEKRRDKLEAEGSP